MSSKKGNRSLQLMNLHLMKSIASHVEKHLPFHSPEEETSKTTENENDNVPTDAIILPQREMPETFEKIYARATILSEERQSFSYSNSTKHCSEEWYDCPDLTSSDSSELYEEKLDPECQSHESVFMPVYIKRRGKLIIEASNGDVPSSDNGNDAAAPFYESTQIGNDSKNHEFEKEITNKDESDKVKYFTTPSDEKWYYTEYYV